MSEETMTVEEVYQYTAGFLQKRITAEQLERIYDVYLEQSVMERREHSKQLVEMFSPWVRTCKNSHSVLHYFFLSFLICSTGEADLYNELLQSCIEDERLSKEKKFGIYSYTTELSFLGTSQKNEKSAELSDCLYQKIYEAFQKECSIETQFLPRAERNPNLIFVFTTQMLNLEHGPTKTLLDRCEVLRKHLHKEIFIINTAEMKGDTSGIPLVHSSKGNYREEYNHWNTFPYHGEEYPFFQCPQGMPSLPIIQEILKIVMEEKPLCIVTIGGNSIVSDLCSHIVPTITIATVFSGRVQTFGQFQVIGRELTEADYQWGIKRNLPREHFLSSRFTFSLKEQEHIYTRKDFLLPESAFLTVLVGMRLDAEIDEECLHMLKRLMQKGIYVVFIGRFHYFEKIRAKDALFASYGINLGRQTDILAVMELMNLYINPKRIGGGTSIIEALYKGVPAVTMDYGDSAKSAGPDFLVQDYEEMYQKVLQYQTDKEFYHEMSQKAKKRAEVMLDSETEFVRIMNTVMERKGFQ